MPAGKVTHLEQTPGVGRCGTEGNTSPKMRGVTCKKCRRKPKQDWRKQADVLFSRLIRERDGRCVRCSSTFNLQCAHIISRSYNSIRVDPDNAVALCQKCHVFFTHRPLEWFDFTEAMFPGRYSDLRQRALEYETVDWQVEVARLSAATKGTSSF